MKVVVDDKACVGCGLCAESCPGVFVMDGSVAKVKGPVAAGDEASCKDAASNCPVTAIVVS